MNILKSIGIKLFILTATAMLFLASQFTNPSANENGQSTTTLYPVPDSQFIIGAFHNASDLNYYYKDSLRFNTWHHYTAPAGWGWFGVTNDNYNAPTNDYGPGVVSRIQANKTLGMRTLMDRPIIEYIVSGQRIDYQCEKIDSGFTTNNHFWFYAYRNSAIVNNNTHYSISDENDLSHGAETKVKYCNKLDDITLDNDILINSNLRSNRELAFDQTNQWMKDNEYKWYIMPRIRIDSLYALGSTHDEDDVCKIIIRGKSSTVKQVVLKVKNFKFLYGSELKYDGSYKEFYNIENQEDLQLSEDEITNYFIDSEPFNYELNHVNNTDVEVYWSGKCDMWIDRVRIENVPAHQYLDVSDPYHQDLVDKVTAEIGWANTNNQIPNYFYFEECQMSHFPLIKALNQQITSGSGNKNELVVWLNYDLFKAHVPNCWNYQFDATMLKAYLYEDYGLRNIVMGSYALEGWKNTQRPGFQISYHPSTLFPDYPHQTYDSIYGILSYEHTPAEYDTWLQEHFDDPVHLSGVNYSYISKLMFSLSKEPGMRVLNCSQAHLWHNVGHKLKEPSNEELELQANLALTNNAKGLIWFSYVCEWTTIGAQYYARGIMDNGGVPRDSNVYGQNKYLKVCQIDSMLERRGPYIMSFEPTLTKNCTYRLEEERPTFLYGTYFNNIITYKPGNGESECEDQNPGGTNPPNLIYDCNEARYLQAATFQTSTSDLNKYFMLVNRRCSPYIDNTTEDRRGGRRNVRVKFDANSSEFAGYNNWEIFCIDSNKTVAAFDKRVSAMLDLGWYMPGQGELYKISPIILGGGTLVSDETISGNVNCNGMIYNGGHNITISPNATITFSENAGIEMNGGNFSCGEYDNANTVTLKGIATSNVWNGLLLSSCSTIGIYNTSISNIKANDTAKAVLISNCNNTNIKKSTFNVGTNAGAIQTVFTANSRDSITFNVGECKFDMGNSSYSAISITSSASFSLPVIIDWCNFNTSNDNSNALILTGVTGGAIKNNTFGNFKNTIIALSSTIDLYNNIIRGTGNSTGIQCLDGSTVSLSPTSGLYLGGYNYIRNYGSSSSNIYSNSSTFDIYCGQNNFDLNDIDNSKHLTGTMSGIPLLSVNAAKNCFHKDSITNIEACHTVTWDSTTDPVNFTFTPYSCELTPPPGDYFVFQSGGYNDTIYRSPGGEGGGFNPNKTLNKEENVYKSLKDTININLRKRNYLTVEDKAKQLLTQFPDSLESIGMVQKLYMASLSLDSTKIGLTKTFLENIIVTNTQNSSLVKRAFYFIQKCKVKLKQYQSALEGFQYIMTQNPYTYEGLVASWDYAATYLLMGSGGSYKGDQKDIYKEQTEELNTPADTLLNRMAKRDINTNKSTNTSTNKTAIEQITKIFYEKIKSVTKDSKSLQEEKVKTLEKTIETSKNKTEKNNAVTELSKMKQIKEVVKIKKPDNIKTHVVIMNGDIKKVFGIGKSSKQESTNNLIPTTYILYQNYPNPFNPVTKIAYDIPKDAKVKLVIYDILGREMKVLVNNEFRSAGKYITEFNGANLSSGIYFARILVNEGKDFIAVKKMVLLK